MEPNRPINLIIDSRQANRVQLDPSPNLDPAKSLKRSKLAFNLYRPKQEQANGLPFDKKRRICRKRDNRTVNPL